jgi:hypothetical protein
MRYALILCATLAIASPAAAAPFAYATTDIGEFGILDLGAGTYLHCGWSGAELFGLAVGKGGRLYGMDTGNFYRVNPHTGAVTFISGAGAEMIAIGSAAHVIYAVDPQSQLYTIDPDTGAVTAVSSGAPKFVDVLSVGAPTLFEFSDGFYEYFARQGRTYRMSQDLNMEWNAIVYVDGVLYGVGEPRFSLTQYVYIINTKNGSATQIATVPNTVIDWFTGMAPTKDGTGTCRLSPSAESTSSDDDD